jgi:hypothetical protein
MWSMFETWLTGKKNRILKEKLVPIPLYLHESHKE